MRRHRSCNNRAVTPPQRRTLKATTVPDHSQVYVHASQLGEVVSCQRHQRGARRAYGFPVVNVQRAAADEARLCNTILPRGTILGTCCARLLCAILAITVTVTTANFDISTATNEQKASVWTWIANGRAMGQGRWTYMGSKAASDSFPYIRL
jgi:hypothetical protein